jgi:hypothetical protein
MSKITEDLEAEIRRWRRWLVMLVEVVGAFFAALIAALVAAAAGRRVAASCPASPPPPPRSPSLEDRQRIKPPEPRWSDRVVRACLLRISAGRVPLSRQMAALPPDVAAWLTQLDADAADDIRNMPGSIVRRAYQRWLDGDMEDGTPSQSVDGLPDDDGYRLTPRL